MLLVLALGHGRHDALDVFLGQAVVLRHLHELLGGVHKQDGVVRLVLFQQHNVHGDGDVRRTGWTAAG